MLQQCLFWGCQARENHHSAAESFERAEEEVHWCEEWDLWGELWVSLGVVEVMH